MTSPEDLWLSRYEALGKAQSRYLYVLLIAVIFFLVVNYRTSTDPSFEYKPIGVSALGLDLPPRILLLFGPILILMVLLAVLGSLRAARHAHVELERLLGSCAVSESIDPVPNLVD